MVRKPGSSSSGSSRPDSPMGSAGRSAAGATNTGSGSGGMSSSGSMSGTAGGSAVGRRGAGVDRPSRTAPPAPVAPAGYPSPPSTKASPALVGLAIAGWTTFAVQWIVILVIVLGRGTVSSTNAAAPYATARTTPASDTTSSTAANPRSTAPDTTGRSTPAATTPPPRSSDNPLLMNQPNVLGLPLSADHTAILLDAIEISSPWLDDVKPALLAGLTQSAGNRRVSLLYSREGAPTALSANPFTPATNRLSTLTRFLNPVSASGRGGLSDSIEAAVDTRADDMIFITSRTSGWGGWLGTLDAKLTANNSRVRLHVIQIGEANDALKGYVESAPNNGTYLNLQPAQLQQWRSAAGR